ncbi:MAG: hypothetical protein IJT49_04125 [Clostridia bacterium]|nr:hypothetical protein [Clostridia bacterium]
MSKKSKRISSKCPLFVCRECRTKTGWRHQKWCLFADPSVSDCTGCLYFVQRPADKSVCVHPRMKERGKNEA